MCRQKEGETPQRALIPGSSVPKTKLERKENRRRRIKSSIPGFTTGLEKVEEVTGAAEPPGITILGKQELLLARDGSTNHNPHEFFLYFFFLMVELGPRRRKRRNQGIKMPIKPRGNPHSLPSPASLPPERAFLELVCQHRLGVGIFPLCRAIPEVYLLSRGAESWIHPQNQHFGLCCLFNDLPSLRGD